jgi:hypothetical protein
VCGTLRGVCEAAHTVDRSLARSGFDDPNLIVPLCRPCHRLYDSHQLDLLPFLALEEQAAMVLEIGIARAMRRATGSTS